MLLKREFDVLEAIASNDSIQSQRNIATQVNISLGTVNKTIEELVVKGFIEEGAITQLGMDALEPYRVKRAIIVAAGFGSRLIPITLNTPKPLVRVNGKRLIDSTLDALISIGITEIYLVRGYLGEQFDQLLYKYPTIKFLENPSYNESNNISSMMCASYYLKNAYVLEGDLLLHNPKLIKKYQYYSNYIGVPVDKTDDWCLLTNNKGIITGMVLGGTNCYQMFGVSYWTEEYGSKLVNHVKEVFQSPGGKERYWDQVPLEYFAKDYEVHIRPCTFDDIIEIDTFSELKRIDKTYDI